MRRESECIGDELAEYADGRLNAARTSHWDFHLITCAYCRHAVTSERRMQDALRLSSPEVPQQLRSALLALAITGVEDEPEPGARRPFAIPHVPLAPPSVVRNVAATPLATVSPSAPALHRSPLRSAVFAAVAASASAAAAIGLSAAGASSTASFGNAVPAANSTANTTVVRSGQARQVSFAWRTTAPGGPQRTAQSTP